MRQPEWFSQTCEFSAANFADPEHDSDGFSHIYNIGINVESRCNRHSLYSPL